MNLRQNLQQTYNQKNWKQWFPELFGTNISIENKAEKVFVNNSNAKAIERFASLKLSDNKNIAVLDITTDKTVKISRNKIGLRNLVTKFIDQDKYHGILAIYHSEDMVQNDYRLSFISSQSAFDGEGNFATSSTNPKRYTFILGATQSCFTAAQRLSELQKKKSISLEDVTNTFSVSNLTKEFYNELFKWYQWVLTEEVGVTFPKNTATADDNRERLEEQIIRLITRLLFVWFIKQKHLVPNNLFDKEALKKILKDFNPNDSKSGSYYNAILQNLFFATLNKTVTERAFAKAEGTRDIKTLYRYAEMFSIGEKEVLKLFSQIPFLNGGLFECLDKETSTDGVKYHLDGFSRNNRKEKGQFSHRAYIPNFVFFDEEKGIIPLLKRYNFTVEENAPGDVQVALDPELLGNVFENLLGAFNSETKDSARKQSGSFYTPREIVDFMVSESLVAYLQSKFQKHSDNIQALFENDELPEELEKDRKARTDIFKALREVKIIDPACGSGAFPMGILNKMVQVLEKLDIESKHDIYDLKLHLIQECIYGVDLQTIAAQISKLRFFISLIVEQGEMDLSKPKQNYNVQTLPNLETKFVAANTLISVGSENRNLLDLKDEKLGEMKAELWEIREGHFYAKGTDVKEKLRLKDEKLREEIKNYLQKNAPKSDEKRVATFKREIAKLEGERKTYENENWVDVTEKSVQTDMFGAPAKKQPSLFRIDKNKKKRDAIDKQIKALQANIGKENSKDKQMGFEAVVEKLAKWNPYDQNSASPFFDTQWMFGVEDGFDIVIGNPPYIQLQQNGSQLAKLYERSEYKTFDRRGDIYSLFYERGWQLLKPKGVLCYVTSNGWMRNDYGENTRNFFAEQTNPILLVDFVGQKIFESATVEVNILMFARDKNQQQTKTCIIKEKLLNNLSVFIRQKATSSTFTNGGSWIVLSDIEQRIKAKIEAVGTPLKDWNINIYRGILTGFNEAFIISGKKKQEIIANCKTANERKITDQLIRPILRGRDIKRYGYNFDDRYLIATFPSRGYNIDDYPAVKNFLEGFRSKLKQTGEKLTDKEVQQILNHANINDVPVNENNLISARKKTNNQWFETQDSISYWDDFSKQKIVWGEISDKTKFCIDLNGEFITEATTFLMTGKSLLYLLGFLNSKFSEYLFSKIGTTTGVGTIRWKKYTIERLHVPCLSAKRQSEYETIVTEIMEKQKNKRDYSILVKELDELIYQDVQLGEEEINFIENQ